MSPDTWLAVLLAIITSLAGGSPDTAERELSIKQPDRGSARSAMPELLLDIKHHESRGNYRAFNATGCSDENGTFSCGGAYQLSEQYAATWADRAGYPHLSSQAQRWPAAAQDAVALHLYLSTNPPGYHWCHWVTYC